MERQNPDHQALLDQHRAPRHAWFTILGALVAASLVGASGYLLGARSQRPVPPVSTPASSPAPPLAVKHTLIASSVSAPTIEQGWRKYHNETYGYSIRHPERWLIAESYLDTAVAGVRVWHALDLGRASAGGYAGGGPTVLVRVMSLEGSTASIAHALISATNGVITDGPITVDGIAGERWSAREGHGGDALFFVRHGRRYILITEGRAATDDVAKSFRFD